MEVYYPGGVPNFPEGFYSGIVEDKRRLNGSGKGKGKRKTGGSHKYKYEVHYVTSNTIEWVDPNQRCVQIQTPPASSPPPVPTSSSRSVYVQIKLSQGNSSGFVGVNRVTRANGSIGYAAYQRGRSLGVFETKKEAAVAYDAAAIQDGGTVVHVNFPKQIESTKRWKDKSEEKEGGEMKGEEVVQG